MEAGNQARSRSSLTWEMLDSMQAGVSEWGRGEIIAWFGLALSYLLLRTLELLARDNGNTHGAIV